MWWQAVHCKEPGKGVTGLPPFAGVDDEPKVPGTIVKERGHPGSRPAEGELNELIASSQEAQEEEAPALVKDGEGPDLAMLSKVSSLLKPIQLIVAQLSTKSTRVR